MLLVYEPNSPTERVVAMFSDGAVYDKPLDEFLSPVQLLLPNREALACNSSCFRYPPFFS